MVNRGGWHKFAESLLLIADIRNNRCPDGKSPFRGCGLGREDNIEKYSQNRPF
jgi:hypothetical protein